MNEDMTRDELHTLIDSVVADLLPDCPPVDAVAIARRLGLDPTSGKKDIPKPQRQSLAAQVVGDHLKPELLRRLGIEGRPLLGVSLTDLAAGRLLVPTPWLRDEGRANGFDLPALTAIFRTAEPEMIAWRLLDLDEPCIITVIDNGRIAKRRSNSLRVSRTLSPAEENCRLQTHKTSRPCVIREEGWTVQGWPIHGVDWKREILRSIIDD